MKAFKIIFILLFLFNISFSQQGWFLQPGGTANYLYWACFVGPNTGWVVGQASTVLKTTNSGLNWIAQNPSAPGFLYSIFFIDQNTGWTVGQSGAIIKTINAGANWSAQTSGFPSEYLYSVFFTDVNTGYIVGSSGLILKTTNGGTNWTQQTSPVTNTLSCLYFPPSATSMIGYAAGGTGTSGTILKTSNAGQSWDLQTVGTNWFFGTYFVNLVAGWAVGFNGVIYRTTDGGGNWVPQVSNTTNRLVAVSFPNNNTGYAVGYSGTIVKTTNAGNNWFAQYDPSTNNLWGVCFIDENTGWAAGWNGTILHTTNGGLVFVKKIGTDVPVSYELSQNYPNPFNPSTKIGFEIPASGVINMFHVRLKIYDIRGKEVAELYNGQLQSGKYEIQWDGNDQPSGVFFYELRTDNFSQAKKMLLLK
jgi:photosystem II stability/assembly factor-like uncharacterized protein